MTSQHSRRRRRDPEQTRDAIVAGLLAAVGDGDFAPTTRAIAARAGTSERSVFVHFPDRDSLLTAAVDRQSDQVESCLTVTDPAAPLTARIASALRDSEAIFALQRTIRLAGLCESRTVTAIDDRMRRTDRHIRDHLARTFAPELTSATGDLDETRLDLIDGTLGWPLRHHLQDRRGASAAAATETLRVALERLLRSADRPAAASV